MSMNRDDVLERLLELYGTLTSGDKGFKRITSSDGTVQPYNKEKVFFAVKAINGNATFASGTTSQSGDDPDGDTLLEGDVLNGSFSSIELSSGTVYAYTR